MGRRTRAGERDHLVTGSSEGVSVIWIVVATSTIGFAAMFALGFWYGRYDS